MIILFVVFLSIAQLNFTMLHTQRSQNGILLKTTLQLCKHYYFKAAEIFTDMNETNDVIVVLLQHIELEEFLAESMLINTVFMLYNNSLPFQIILMIFSYIFFYIFFYLLLTCFALLYVNVCLKINS